jgi:hypothetical protein
MRELPKWLQKYYPSPALAVEVIIPFFQESQELVLIISIIRGAKIFPIKFREISTAPAAAFELMLGSYSYEKEIMISLWTGEGLLNSG